ncbi:MAG TPA: hypothetical protein VIF11_13265 [Methylomirabilota bacterium]|jgi:hypothetical protein
MTDWWSELEHELLTCVEEIGLATPAEVGRRLGFSETSAASLLAILVREGKVRMCLVQSAAQGGLSGTTRGDVAGDDVARRTSAR